MAALALIGVLFAAYQRSKRRQADDEMVYAAPVSHNALHGATPPVQLDRNPATSRNKDDHPYAVLTGPERYYSEAGPAEPGAAASSYAVPIDAVGRGSGESCYAAPDPLQPAIYDGENQTSGIVIGAGLDVPSFADYAEPGYNVEYAESGPAGGPAKDAAAPGHNAAPSATVDYAPAYAVFRDAAIEQQRPTSVSDA